MIDRSGIGRRASDVRAHEEARRAGAFHAKVAAVALAAQRDRRLLSGKQQLLDRVIRELGALVEEYA